MFFQELPTFEEFIHFDDDIAICTNQIECIQNDDEDSDESDVEEIQTPVKCDLERAIKILRDYSNTTNVSLEFIEHLRKIKKEISNIYKPRLTQTNIQMFLKWTLYKYSANKRFVYIYIHIYNFYRV